MDSTTTQPVLDHAAEANTSSVARAAWGVTIFLSATLLFQVQPILAKTILPWFGGGAGVWTVCLMFFQVTYLLGNLYAHWLTRRAAPRRQSRAHAVLLFASLLVLPIVPRTFWRPVGGGDPTWRILGLLTLTVGLPFLLLSATSPLLQSWYARARADARPYRFYALSNAGSLLGLLSYPVLVEPLFTTRHQAAGWSLVYVGFVILCGAIALRQPAATEALPRADSPASPRPDWKRQLLWVALAADASALLLAVTSYISQNVAAVPLLWILPLSLYLLSLILCFEGRGWYRRSFYLQLVTVALAGMAYALSPAFSNAGPLLQVPLFCIGLFICCMVCHGELAALKPSPDHLTLFYLMVSAGGALGGIFVGGIAPHIFRGFYELSFSLGLFGILLFLALRRDPPASLQGNWRPLYTFVGAILAVALCVFLVYATVLQAGGARLMQRNFYGVLRVDDVPATAQAPARRQLINGTIIHGTELAARDLHMYPTAYYGPQSGAGLALAAARARGNLRVGVIGLGAGTLATYGRLDDHFTFYEINPLVIEVASTQFDFLRGSGAQIEIVPGDARLSLERAAPQNFDLLLVDAFSGDAIPVHLLTREAFELYLHHLGPQGWLLIHASNKFLDLRPVVEAAAQSLGLKVTTVTNPADPANAVEMAVWMFLRRPGNSLPSPDFPASELTPESPRKKLRLWTDDYSNLLQILK